MSFVRNTRARKCAPRLAVRCWLALPLLALNAVCPFAKTQPPQTPEVLGAMSDRRDLSAELARAELKPEQVALLTVAPPKSFAVRRALPVGEAFRAAALADAFGRKLLEAGSITVLAPRLQTEIVTRPGTPRLLTGMDTRARMEMLLSSLTQEQWSIAGAAGLGVADLTDEQQTLFLSGFAPRMQKVRYVWQGPVPGGSGIASEETSFPAADGEPEPLDPTQIRLRLARGMTFQFLSPLASGTADKNARVKLNSGYDFDPGQPSRVSGSVMYAIEPVLPEAPADDEEEPEGAIPQAFGVPLARRVPNQPKPGDLNFAAPALNVSVALDEPPATVRGWMERIEDATGITFRADARIAGLAAVVRARSGAKVPAGDLLLALAVGLPGAFRRVGNAGDTRPVYLLTDDREGIGTRFARLEPWATRAENQRQQLRFAGKREPVDVWAALPLAPGHPLAGNAALNRQAEAAFRHANRPYAAGERERPDEEGGIVKTRDLPPALQRNLRDAQNQIRSRASAPDFDDDQVRMQSRLDITYVLPDGTQVSEGFLNAELGRFFLSQQEMKRQTALTRRPKSIPAPSPVVTLVALPTVSRRVLWIPLPRGAEVAEIAEKAARRGFTDIWVRAADGGEGFDVSTLPKVIAGAKKQGLTVSAVVSLLRGPTGEPEVNVLGQEATRDLPPLAELLRGLDATEAQKSDPALQDTVADSMRRDQGWRATTVDHDAARVQHLVRLAEVPGLAGLILTDTRPGGYESAESSVRFATAASWGYTAAQRKTFLLREGVDPLDIVPRLYALPVIALPRYGPVRTTPFSENGREGYRYYYFDKLWDTFRAQVVDERLARLYNDFRKTRPVFPLWLEDGPLTDRTGEWRWFGSWDKGVPRPHPVRYSPPSSRGRNAHALSKLAFWYDRHGPAPLQPETPEQFARQFKAAAAFAGAGWDGMVVDLSELTISDAMRLLDGLRFLPPRGAQSAHDKLMPVK